MTPTAPTDAHLPCTQVNSYVRSIPALPNIVSRNATHIGGSYLYQALELSMVGPKLLPRKALPRNFVALAPTED